MNHAIFWEHLARIRLEEARRGAERHRRVGLTPELLRIVGHRRRAGILRAIRHCRPVSAVPIDS